MMSAYLSYVFSDGFKSNPRLAYLDTEEGLTKPLMMKACQNTNLHDVILVQYVTRDVMSM